MKPIISDCPYFEMEQRMKREKQVIVITDANGKEYVFEKPAFPCELLSVVESTIIGWAINKSKGVNPISCHWDLKGNSKRKYIKSLIPIPPVWYEDPSNFPCVCVMDGEMSIEMYYPLNEGTKVLLQQNLLRLATREEVYSLYHKE